MKFIHHGDVDYPLFCAVSIAIDFYRSVYDSFEVSEVWVLTDFEHTDGELYWLYQIFFSFVCIDERISNSVIVCIPDENWVEKG